MVPVWEFLDVLEMDGVVVVDLLILVLPVVVFETVLVLLDVDDDVDVREMVDDFVDVEVALGDREDVEDRVDVALPVDVSDVRADLVLVREGHLLGDGAADRVDVMEASGEEVGRAPVRARSRGL